jgi:hypothetical protein
MPWRSSSEATRIGDRLSYFRFERAIVASGVPAVAEMLTIRDFETEAGSATAPRSCARGARGTGQRPVLGADLRNGRRQRPSSVHSPASTLIRPRRAAVGMHDEHLRLY